MWSKPKLNLPPGPTGYPIIGYVLHFVTNNLSNVMDLKIKYGNIFGVRIGSEFVVFLNSAETVREAFVKTELLERAPYEGFAVVGHKSTFFTHGMAVWKEQRRFVVQALRDLGVGKSKIEGHILEEVNHFVEYLKSFQGAPVEFEKKLDLSVARNSLALVFGKIYDYNDPEMELVNDCLDKISRVVGLTKYFLAFSWIQYFPFIIRWIDPYGGIVAMQTLTKICKKHVKEHQETFDPQNIRDFTDSYLLELKRRREINQEGTFTDATLIANIEDIFGAATETVRITTSWAIYTMADHIDVQENVQKEIYDVIGTDTYPQFSDQKRMPYTKAVIMEVLRWKTTIPYVPRYCIEDTKIAGYDIPKGTTVISSQWVINHDADHFTDPDSFRPERFLDAEQENIKKSISYMPFSFGKRKCPGENMAYMEVFLYFVSILQNFNLRFPEGFVPTYDADLTLALQAKPFSVHMIPRKM